MHLLALTNDDAQAWAILIAALAAAISSVIAAIYTARTHQAQKLPSNHLANGAATENTSVNLATLVHLVADEFGKKVQVPTVRQTAAQLPGSTLADPPAPPTDKEPTP